MASDDSRIDENSPFDPNIIIQPLNNRADLSFEALFKLIMFESTEPLRLQKLEELKKLATSQSEIGFLNNLRKTFMLGANEDGSFTVNEDLQKLLDKISLPGNEGLMHLLNELGLEFKANDNEQSFQQLFSDIENLTDKELSQSLSDQLKELGIEKDQKPTQAQLDELVKFISQPENSELRKHVANNKILKTKETFTKAERENFIESIRLFVEQKNTLNEMTTQSIMRLQAEIDKMQLHVLELVKIHRDIIRKIQENTRRGG